MKHSDMLIMHCVEPEPLIDNFITKSEGFFVNGYEQMEILRKYRDTLLAVRVSRTGEKANYPKLTNEKIEKEIKAVEKKIKEHYNL